MQAYLDILRSIKEEGEFKGNRTGIHTKYISGAFFKHDMREGFPLQTTKKVDLRNVAVELEFFIEGMNDKSWLQKHNCRIWDGWCNPKKVPYGNSEKEKAAMKAEKDLGEIYGVQWRFWDRPTSFFGKLAVRWGLVKSPVDQLKKVVDTLKKNPLDRRMLVTAWNPKKLDQMALPPCHYGFQFISDGKNLDLFWNQRSVDTPLGLPYNIASYGLLLEIMAKTVGMVPRYLGGFLADVHYYTNQEEAVETILSRTPGKLPKITITKDIFEWTHEDFILEGYEHQGFVKIPVAV